MEQEKKDITECKTESCADTIEVSTQEEQKNCCIQLHECQDALAVWQEKCKRATADFENYKRRMYTEQQSWTIAAQKQILLDVLAIVDDFERALEQQKIIEVSSDLRSWVDGTTMVYNAVLKILQRNNIRAIEETTEFDPMLHEAIMQVESKDHTSGQVVQVLQKGYMIGDAVLRPAKVSVAK